MCADHINHTEENGIDQILIDQNLALGVTLTQTFEGLKNASQQIQRKDFTFTTIDHNIPTFYRNNSKSIEPVIRVNEFHL